MTVNKSLKVLEEEDLVNITKEQPNKRIESVCELTERGKSISSKKYILVNEMDKK